MASKTIKDITLTQSTALATDWFEIQQDDGTSKKIQLSTLKTYFDNYYGSLPIGTSIEFSGMYANIPSNYMVETGASLLRSSYTSCFSALSAVIGTVSISIASPGVVTSTGHPFQTGDCIHLTTTGALPTGQIS